MNFPFTTSLELLNKVTFIIRYILLILTMNALLFLRNRMRPKPCTYISALKVMQLSVSAVQENVVINGTLKWCV